MSTRTGAEYFRVARPVTLAATRPQVPPACDTPDREVTHQVRGIRPHRMLARAFRSFAAPDRAGQPYLSSRRVPMTAYYCGWAITGRTTISHLVSASRFPIAGSRHRSWCGETITVLALTLDARHLPGSCPDCNRYLRENCRGLLAACDHGIRPRTHGGEARMSSPAQVALLDHVGPWTEQDYLALPEDRRRIELLDGGLLMSPSAGSRHQRLSSQLWHALGRAAPSWLEVLEAINVRVAPGRILISDLVVVTKPGLDLTVWDPGEVAMVVEIVSPGSVAADRAIKPQLYSAAGIDHYLRIELSAPEPSSMAYRLQRGRYVETESSKPGQLLYLAEPFPIDLDLAKLATATRPPE